MKIHFFKNNLRARSLKKRGFTLVETLVAITIVVVGVTAPLAVSSRNIQASLYARNQLIGTFLAQEGIELVRNIRDRDLLATPPVWLPVSSSGSNKLGDCLDTVCVIDSVGSESVNNELYKCSSLSECKFLYFDQSTGAYDQPYASAPNGSNFTQSIFKRTLTLVRPANDTNKEVIARVTVTWTIPSGQKSITLDETLFKFIQ